MIKTRERHAKGPLSAAMFEAAAKILVTPARRLHHGVEREVVDHHDSDHLSSAARFGPSSTESPRRLHAAHANLASYTGLRRELEHYLADYNCDRVHPGRLTNGRIPAAIVYGARKMKDIEISRNCRHISVTVQPTPPLRRWG